MQSTTTAVQIRNNFNSFTTTTATTMNMRTIFAVMNTTWAEVKLKPEKNSGLYGTWTGIVEVMGSNPAPYRPKLFRPYFYYCSSSVHYCEDRFHIHASHFKYMTFIYSLTFINDNNNSNNKNCNNKHMCFPNLYFVFSTPSNPLVDEY